jgi:hypothetical protein
MSYFKNAATLLLLQTLLCACSRAAVESPTHPFVVNHSATGKTYYHLMYALTADDLLSVERMDHAQFVANGGQFEVEIKKSAFPIQAPHCEGNIILRMPWVSAGNDLSEKYQLYSALSTLVDSAKGSVSVALELNPYIEKTAEGIQLQYCNVFFRHASKQYIPHMQVLNQ